MAPEMMEVAREIATGEGMSNIEFRLVDGEEIDLAADSFDAVDVPLGDNC